MNEIRRAIADRFNERAASYDESAMHRGLAGAVVDFAPLVPGVETVLDIATGTGLVLRALPSPAPARLIGVDISIGMLRVAHGELPGALLLEADAGALPLRAASVDMITCVTALHVIQDVRIALAEWHRVLAPGGRVVTATFAQLPESGHGYRSGYSDHVSFASPAVIGELFASAQLRLSRHATWTYGSGEEEEIILLSEFVA